MRRLGAPRTAQAAEAGAARRVPCAPERRVLRKTAVRDSASGPIPQSCAQRVRKQKAYRARRARHAVAASQRTRQDVEGLTTPAAKPTAEVPDAARGRRSKSLSNSAHAAVRISRAVAGIARAGAEPRQQPYHVPPLSRGSDAASRRPTAQRTPRRGEKHCHARASGGAGQSANARRRSNPSGSVTRCTCAPANATAHRGFAVGAPQCSIDASRLFDTVSGARGAAMMRDSPPDRALARKAPKPCWRRQGAAGDGGRHCALLFARMCARGGLAAARGAGMCSRGSPQRRRACRAACVYVVRLPSRLQLCWQHIVQHHKKYSATALRCGRPRASCGAASKTLKVSVRPSSISMMAATLPQR